MGARWKRFWLVPASWVVLLALVVAGTATAPQAAATDNFAISPTQPPGATTGGPYTFQIQATGGTTPYRYYVVQGAVPPGLSVTSFGLISGTPGPPPVDQPTTYTFYISGTDAGGGGESIIYNLVLTPLDYVAPGPLAITTTSIPDATFNTPYSFTMSATGGTQPYRWYGWNFPQGMSISTSGVISGTSTLPAQTQATIEVQSGTNYSADYVDSNGLQIAQQTYTFTVTSGYSQLDPTFFELSDLLASGQAQGQSLVNQIQLLVNQIVYEVTSPNGLEGEIFGLAAQAPGVACDVFYALNIPATLHISRCPVAGGI
jgi:hypothetical protein